MKWQFQFIVSHLPLGHGHVQWVNLTIFCQFKLGYWLMNLAIGGVCYYLVSPGQVDKYSKREAGIGPLT